MNRSIHYYDLRSVSTGIIVTQGFANHAPSIMRHPNEQSPNELLWIALDIFPRTTHMNKIPDKYSDLLDRPAVVSLAALMSDGPPQVQPA